MQQLLTEYVCITFHPPCLMLSGVSIVSAEHKSIDHNKIRLAPIRWANCPAGTCVTTYPQKKLLKTNALVFSSQSWSCLWYSYKIETTHNIQSK